MFHAVRRTKVWVRLMVRPVRMMMKKVGCHEEVAAALYGRLKRSGA